MSVDQQVDALATSVENLKSAVVSKKATLDASVVDAQSATAQVQAAKSNALSARDQAGAFKDAAYTAAQSAASAVAYQDLTALAASKAVTAVDVFIYDTSKDSDGGAWRHRCAGTSWYREALNTATRGARREFPAIAVIVVGDVSVWIYDGDDTALPLWGRISNAIASYSATNNSSVTARNGVICIGGDAGYGGLAIINFPAAKNTWHGFGQGGDSAGVYVQENWNTTTIRPRLSTAVRISGEVLVNRFVNDVAMIVLLDAPIDPATGLPVPTIAVATDSGVSVIKDDGTVVDWTRISGTVASNISFRSLDGALCVSFDSSTTGRLRHVLYNLPSADILDGHGYVAGSSDEFYPMYPGGLYTGTSFPLSRRAAMESRGWNGLADAGSSQLSQIAPNRVDPTKGLLAVTTSTYNTGWMPGAIRGAFLADTDDADLVGDGALTAPDRSVANKPLLVMGTITRTPVATGAELIAYSGFSETNYLEGTDATYADTLYALCWVQTNGRWEFRHGLVSASPIDGLTITATTLKIAGTKPKALVRITATTPTMDQLAKIEADERLLFHENAACTLYGASDAVTALAHDPDTGLLHVGTSAGRSVFKGLRRVANTTVPVTTAIAAAGGMVVDE
jgi:hypothetical protein